MVLAVVNPRPQTFEQQWSTSFTHHICVMTVDVQLHNSIEYLYLSKTRFTLIKYQAEIASLKKSHDAHKHKVFICLQSSLSCLQYTQTRTQVISNHQHFKGTVHPEMTIYSKCTHFQVIQDVDEFVSSSDLEKCSIISLFTNGSSAVNGCRQHPFMNKWFNAKFLQIAWKWVNFHFWMSYSCKFLHNSHENWGNLWKWTTVTCHSSD